MIHHHQSSDFEQPWFRNNIISFELVVAAIVFTPLLRPNDKNDKDEIYCPRIRPSVIDWFLRLRQFHLYGETRKRFNETVETAFTATKAVDSNFPCFLLLALHVCSIVTIPFKDILEQEEISSPFCYDQSNKQCAHLYRRECKHKYTNGRSIATGSGCNRRPDCSRKKRCCSTHLRTAKGHDY